jgi:hypothetical protein
MSEDAQRTDAAGTTGPDAGAHPTGAARAYAPPTQSGALPDEHPEAIVGAAFLGGLVIAKVLKRLGG